MILINCNIYFRYFLHVIASAIRLHQSIGLFYDFDNLDRMENFKIRKEFVDFRIFYNLTFFTDFVPGFLTNPSTMGVFGKRPRFTLVIFLNFNPFSGRQAALLNEIQVNKMEYILFSPHELDVSKYSPYLYFNLDLNDLSLLKIIKFYIIQYTLLWVNPFIHNLKGDPLARKTFNLNCLYALILLRNKILLKNHLKLICTKKSELYNFNHFFVIFVQPSAYKMKFVEKYMDVLDCIGKNLQMEKNLRILSMTLLKRLHKKISKKING